MIELELFYKLVEAKTREEYEEYLKAWCRLLRRKKISRKDKFLQGYSKGVEKALSVLAREFRTYNKRLKKAERNGVGL